MKSIIGGKAQGNEPQVRLLVIDEASEGQRLDNFLLRELQGVPKAHVYRIVRSGEVRVNKARAQPDQRLAPGDVVRVPPVRQAPAEPGPHDAAPAVVPAREFSVLKEDEVMLAIDKPSGVAVHGGSGLSYGVIEQLRRSRPEARFLELVHRLDRDTSGVLLVAKKRSALTALQAQFRDRTIGKTYLALVRGTWPPSLRVIDLPLVKFHLESTAGEPQGERRVRLAAAGDEQSLRSITLVKVRQVLGDFTLLEVTIKTGRTHQIRVHLASSGHPIVGDDKYGDFALNKSLQRAALPSAKGRVAPRLQRMFLHAWRLQFAHPSSGERVELFSELPPELRSFVEQASAQI